MAKRPSASEQEITAAARAAPRRSVAAPRDPVLAMLVRRGFRPRRSAPDLPFPPEREEEVGDRFSALLDHYSFRLFLRGAILKARGFAPEEASRYAPAAQQRAHAEALVELGLARRLPGGARYRLVHAPHNFGPTLEWYLARELRRRLGFDIATGLRFGARGVGGDLDVVACADGRLIYVELKSGPPKHLSDGEIASYLGRLRALRPDVALFAMDTTLRLSDKVLPMFRAAAPALEPRRLIRELWALGPHLFVANANPDLVGNVAFAIAKGLRELAPAVP